MVSPQSVPLISEEKPRNAALTDVEDTFPVSMGTASKERRLLRGTVFAAVGLVLLMLLLLRWLVASDPRDSVSQDEHASPADISGIVCTEVCAEPLLRREWRSVSQRDRKSYITAVMCLQTVPSRLGLNHTLWEDFPYVHVWFGHDAHDGVSFFAYHRWMLHLYEEALRSECHYSGPMLYWDWSLDWENPFAAPVFDIEYGFGGDGDLEMPGYRGFCIEDGPLAGYSLPFAEYITYPHCLSREFMRPGDEFDHWRQTWKPERIEEAMTLDNLNDFVDRVEYGMHRAVPKLIGGDFTTKTAPADPIFFLHHVQLDRLYWTWQQRDPDTRMWQYHGRKTREDVRLIARPTDRLMYGDIGPSVIVNQTLDIQGKCLCYRYW